MFLHYKGVCMSDIKITKEEGFDLVQILPQDVCSKLMQLKIKDNVVIDAEFVGGCSGNLGGIKILIQGMNVKDIVEKLTNIPCGSRTTSCPDQIAKGLASYIEQKQAVKA